MAMTTNEPFRYEEYVEFHSAAVEETIEAILIIDLSNLPPEIGISFRLSQLNTSIPLNESISGIMSQHEADPTTEPVPEVEGISFGNTTYVANPSGLVRIKGVNIKSPDYAAMVLYIIEQGRLKSPAEYTFEVHQIENGEVVGGSTYVIRIENDKPLIGSTPFEEERENALGFEYIHPWLMDFKKPDS